MKKEVVVYIKQDYSINESIWVREDLTKDEIISEVNKNFNDKYNIPSNFKLINEFFINGFMKN